jgi:hypothetical protein
MRCRLLCHCRRKRRFDRCIDLDVLPNQESAHEDNAEAGLVAQFRKFIHSVRLSYRTPHLPSMNPFSSNFIQPGALAYECFGRSEQSDSGPGGTIVPALESLIDRLLAVPNRCSMIVGPHGSGKSTLIHSLIQACHTRQPPLATFHRRYSSSGSFEGNRESIVQIKMGSVVFIDGYEQIGWVKRIGLRLLLKRRSSFLVATMHRKQAGFTLLWETSIDPSIEEWVLESLLQKAQVSGHWKAKILASAEWHQSRLKHGQNLRETLFDMYDWWQANAQNQV